MSPRQTPIATRETDTECQQQYHHTTFEGRFSFSKGSDDMEEIVACTGSSSSENSETIHTSLHQQRLPPSLLAHSDNGHQLKRSSRQIHDGQDKDYCKSANRTLDGE